MPPPVASQRDHSGGGIGPQNTPKFLLLMVAATTRIAKIFSKNHKLWWFLSFT
jgi:hypothetical protein